MYAIINAISIIIYATIPYFSRLNLVFVDADYTSIDLRISYCIQPFIGSHGPP